MVLQTFSALPSDALVLRIILQENILSDAQAEVMNVFEPFRFRALLHSEQTSSSIHDTSGT